MPIASRSSRPNASLMKFVAIALATCVGAAGGSTPSATQPAATQPVLENRVRLLLPPVIYAVPGIESNIYFDNVVLVLNRDNYAFQTICDKGLQLEERWSFTPKPEDVGEFPVEIAVRDESNAVLARAKTIVKVVPADRNSKLTLLLVGASLTEYSIYPQHILDLDQADPNFSLTLLGTRGPKNAPATGPLRHEGYSGWTAQAFATSSGTLSRTGQYKRPETGSPFVYEDEPGKKHLDFARYCKETAKGVLPDAITIQLLPNDVFSCTDENIDEQMDKTIGFYDDLLATFHKANPAIRVGIVLPAPATPSQDGFRNYKGPRRQTSWQYRRNIHRAWERMIAKYAGRESEQIYLVPNYVNFDAERGYPTWTAPAHARSSEKVVRVNNGTHPSPDGYFQGGDSIYCWLKAVAP